MGISDREDFSGRVAKITKVANENNLSPQEMITLLSDGKIEEYLAGKNAEKVEINEGNSRPDFSDLGIGEER